ncbi:hypothetical protein [Paenibacillus sp. XY044]|uniref:hypothetical protein n=1 Tax=Paenibacillus sp. XY044 TaxID=2026089 RepID=UPI000B997AF6|nr:hypothetical protein [Paenibacillus sp. XY044]OZB98140.1 hypothetical protein CJP46_02930 [Paenibacillus sp. XY044]
MMHITIEEVVEIKDPLKPWMKGNDAAQKTTVYAEVDANNEVSELIVLDREIFSEDKNVTTGVSEKESSLIKKIIQDYVKMK